MKICREPPCELVMRARELWMQGHLCDVTLKSCDGQTHRGHRIILSAASNALKALLGENFSEGQQIQQGQPIEIAASGDVLRALLDHIYGGEPEISSADATELLRLAGAYELPKLAAAIEEDMRANMDGPMALQVLQQIHAVSSTNLREACEDEIARDFESCVKLESFTRLSPPQLTRLLARHDLQVTREEVVLEGLFKWVKACRERKSHLGTLLQLIDLKSLSAQNLKRLGVFAQSMGQVGFEVQYSADEALRLQRSERLNNPPAKRRCLQHWSPELGSCPSSHSGGRWVAGDLQRRRLVKSFCWHQDHFYLAHDAGLTRWKSGETSGGHLLSGDSFSKVAISSEGHICVVAAEGAELRVYDFASCELGPPRTLVNIDGSILDCGFSPNGVLYVLGWDRENRERRRWVKRLDGSNLVPVPLDFPPGFFASRIFVCQGDVLYAAGEFVSARFSILRFDPCQTEPVVVGRWQTGLAVGLFVTERGRVYGGSSLSSNNLWHILCFDDGETTPREVVTTAGAGKPTGISIHGESLYVLTFNGKVYEYAFPPALELE